MHNICIQLIFYNISRNNQLKCGKGISKVITSSKKITKKQNITHRCSSRTGWTMLNRREAKTEWIRVATHWIPSDIQAVKQNSISGWFSYSCFTDGTIILYLDSGACGRDNFVVFGEDAFGWSNWSIWPSRPQCTDASSIPTAIAALFSFNAAFFSFNFNAAFFSFNCWCLSCSWLRTFIRRG